MEIPVPPARTLQLIEERKQHNKLSEINVSLSFLLLTPLYNTRHANKLPWPMNIAYWWWLYFFVGVWHNYVIWQMLSHFTYVCKLSYKIGIIFIACWKSRYCICSSLYQNTIEDIAKFETKLAAVLPPSKAFDQGDMSDVLQKQEAEQQSQVMLHYTRLTKSCNIELCQCHFLI